MSFASSNKKSIGVIILAVVIGLIIGSFMTEAFQLLPDNVVKQFFTKSISFGFGFDPDGLVIDLGAIRFKFGFTCKFSFLSLVGVGIGVYILRWYT